ncbi:Synaptosomal-associated protein 25 [Acromyrmex echinatior]|uniref:Synaptosomal-associated protein n=1 Tax=Acromyrmex echinatior TaxID=103372 RepID=F4X3B1_ACREC|nr:Synaptosomal-associated protein 25 [Acromyrmex echinatior]
MDQINADMREAEKNLTGMEKCCGLCVLPCNKGASFKEDEGTWKGNDDGKVVNNQPQRVMDDRNGIGPQSGYIAKITNDARETEMEENMGQVNTMIGNLRNMAIDMGSELENQNRQIDRINRKGESNETRIAVANQRAHALLKSGVLRLPRAVKASHWDVSSLPVHTLLRSITRTVTLVVIVSRTNVADDGNGMPLVDPFERPRVRTAPFSTSFRSNASSGSIGLTRLTRGGRAACEFHLSRWFAWISPICQGRRIERDEDTGGQRASPPATQVKRLHFLSTICTPSAAHERHYHHPPPTTTTTTITTTQQQQHQHQQQSVQLHSTSPLDRFARDLSRFVC